MTNEGLRILFFGSSECPKCGATCQPADGCHDRMLEARWECDDDEDCGWSGSARDLIRSALERAKKAK